MNRREFLRVPVAAAAVVALPALAAAPVLGPAEMAVGAYTSVDLAAGYDQYVRYIIALDPKFHVAAPVPWWDVAECADYDGERIA